MYAKKIQITNYGPIDQLDIDFPFEGDVPKPAVLVGENGSGKSILLSHIVNGLISAKGIAYPETPEVETGRVYKLRSPSYIKSGKEIYFTRVDFENKLFLEEMVLAHPKQGSDVPAKLSGTDAQNAWQKIAFQKNDYYHSNFDSLNLDKTKDIVSRNCVLYFPPNRFEDPPWLNEENLKAKAQYMDLKHIEGYTSRRVINYSPLHDNQNWLFDVIYDRDVFEQQTVNFPLTISDIDQSISLPLLLGSSGNATNVYNIALQVVRSVMNKTQSIRFGIGRRRNRHVSIMENEIQIIPDIFQMSSGETSLLNLFLSILRDFDLCGTSLTNAEDIRGIVVVDEIDLHLHAVHQYAILPKLIQMFPKVQFVVTTHSPLFVLGMKNTFGEDGFALYRLPQGQPINPEEFSEFESAYHAFRETSKFSDDIRTAVENAQKPIVFVEGTTDQRYIQKASELLGHEAILERIEIQEVGGAPNLDHVWHLRQTDFIRQCPKVILLYDCDCNKTCQEDENVFRRKIQPQSDHPIKKGIENLFSKATLERAKNHKLAFIDVTPAYKKIIRGTPEKIPEKWEVNKDEKTNLCDWLCENGTMEDFQHFSKIFDLLREILEPDPSLSNGQSTQIEQNLADSTGSD